MENLKAIFTKKAEKPTSESFSGIKQAIKAVVAEDHEKSENNKKRGFLKNILKTKIKNVRK
jgi:hypothetical protein